MYSFFFCIDSLEAIRNIKDQTCPYLKYYPIEKRGNRIDDIVMDDRPDQRTRENSSSGPNYAGFFYQFKPYE
jgi:hypothetical protein